MLQQTATDKDVLQVVRRWSSAQRVSLVQDILQSLSVEMRTSVNQPKNTLTKALGLLVTTAPAPSDTQIREWLDERRSEKYA